MTGAGTDLVTRVVDVVGDLPVIGIGGIDATNAGEVLAAGARGVAVRSAILRADDPARAAEAIRKALG